MPPRKTISYRSSEASRDNALLELHVDLILLKLHDFDIILGVDWLETHHDLVDYFAKKVTFHILGQPNFFYFFFRGVMAILLFN